ncbi:MAG: hypothetical protein QNI96_11885, partial [Woeseiaceae bacterium]|nr:hypothetical protein [Woeseiaceae bacterium]
METEAEIVLETAPEQDTESSAIRALPFSFAKRHGVLIRDITAESADTVCRPGVSALSIAEVQRFAGVPLKLSRVTQEAFDTLLQESYEQGSNKAMQM